MQHCDIWLAHWVAQSSYHYGQKMWQNGLKYSAGMQIDSDICFIDYPAQTENWYKTHGKTYTKPTMKSSRRFGRGVGETENSVITTSPPPVTTLMPLWTSLTADCKKRKSRKRPRKSKSGLRLRLSREQRLTTAVPSHPLYTPALTLSRSLSATAPLSTMEISAWQR